MATAPQPGLLAALRAATAEAHLELDQRLGLHAETVTPDRYLTFLRASSSVVAPIEVAIARWLGAADDHVSRASALEADLLALGSTVAPAAAAPELRSLADAMGAAYVVEGSALGGSVLARMIAQALGPETPRQYLTLRGERTGDRWRAFLRTLEAWDAEASAGARTTACDAASATFAAYSAAFKTSGAFA